jgi:hypothetical protein
MPRLSAAIIDLRHSEREILETLLNRHNTPQQLRFGPKNNSPGGEGGPMVILLQALG